MAAYSRLASRSQAKFHTMKLSPLVHPCAAAPAQSTTSAYHSLRISPPLVNGRESNHSLYQWPSQAFKSNTKIEDSCGCLWSSSAGLRWKFWQVGYVRSHVFTSLSRRTCGDKMAEGRSRDRSSSAESQPKFPGCSHLCHRNDNHLRC